jgi:hypothetical protein
MQKFIRIALPCVCFAVIIWCCWGGGFDYLDWKWLVGVAGIGVVCYIGLYVKLHKLLQKQKEEHLCLLKKQAKQAEEAVAPELEKVKGNWLKKDMIKRRMVKEYLEKNTDYYANAYDNNAISKVQDWISSLWWSLCWLCLPFASIIIWVIVAILMALLFYWSFSTEMAICCAFSVAASIILVWRRYYVLAPIAIGLAVILLYGLLNAGLDGVEIRAYNMVLENEGIIFLSPSHAEYTMWGSMVIPYVLLCAINADLAVMLGISYNAAFIVIFVYLAWLFPVIFAQPAFIRSWKGMGELKERSPLSKKAKYRRLYYVCLAWLIMNALAAALVWGRFLGIPIEGCAEMMVKDTHYISKFIGIGYYTANFIVYCAPILTSALFSWILFAITKQKIKLKEDCE